MNERMWEDMVERGADSYVDKIPTAINLEGRLYTGNQLSNWCLNGPSLQYFLLVIQGN
jgi:hypothetical protein